MEVKKVSEDILKYLKLHGPQPAQALAEAFNVTPMAVRQHLYLHNKNGLVDYRDDATGRGRPKRIWQLTDKAQQLYSDQSWQQMSFLIEGLLEHNFLSTKSLIKVYEHALSKRFPITKNYLNTPVSLFNHVEMLDILEKEANMQGYLFSYSFDGEDGIRLKECHEPMQKIASQHEFVKTIEMNKYRLLLGKIYNVSCQTHILLGAPSNQYQIKVRDIL